MAENETKRKNKQNLTGFEDATNVASFRWMGVFYSFTVDLFIVERQSLCVLGVFLYYEITKHHSQSRAVSVTEFPLH